MQEFVEAFQVPVNCRRLSRGTVSEEHPLSVHTSWRGQFWKEADLVLQIGHRAGYLDGFGEPPAWPTKAKRVVINESRAEAWMPIATEAVVVGSPKLVLRQMIAMRQAEPDRPLVRGEWLTWLKSCRTSVEAAHAASVGEVAQWKPIHAFYAAREVAQAVDRDTTIVLDAFTGSSHLTGALKMKHEGLVLDAGDWAGVGHGIGMGIGAQVARPGKPVFVMMGDGGMAVGGGDIETALRYKLPIVYFVNNNSTWMAGLYEMYYKGQAQSWNFMPNNRYDKMFEALGAHAELVTEPEQIRPAIQRAFESGKTSVINAVTDNRVPNPFIMADAVRRFFLLPLDLNKLPKETRDLCLKGYGPEVEAELKKKGWPPLVMKGKVSRFDQGRPLFDIAIRIREETKKKDDAGKP